MIRHGQAGPRHDYDRLSELGERQARLLGEHLAAQGAGFAAAYTGSLQRQKRTARLVVQAYDAAGLAFPELIEDPLWDEFDLDALYRALADPLREDDALFRRELDVMTRSIENGDAQVHRSHNYCDIAVVRAWTSGRYRYGGESWPDFQERIASALRKLSGHGSGKKIAVFTSATPIALAMGRALKLADQEVWRLAGATYNSGLSTLRLAEEGLRVFTFNSVPHLLDPDLLSFR